MDAEKLLLVAWSYGLAGLLYTVFPIGLIARGYLRAPRDLPRTVLLLAMLSSAAWAWLVVSGTWFDQYLLLRLAGLVDVLRYGAWFWFILALMRVPSTQVRDSGLPLLRWGVLLVMVVAIALQVLPATGAYPVEALRKAYPNYFLDTHQFV